MIFNKVQGEVFEIVAAGVIVGRVEAPPLLGGRYHAVIDTSIEAGDTIYQGIGDTPQGAVEDLLDKHERQAIAQIRQLGALRKAMEVV